MTRLALLVFLMVPAWALTADPICIRNYGTEKGSPCKNFPLTYAFVNMGVEEGDSQQGEDLEESVLGCVRIYADSYCKNTKAYGRVKTREGKTICVVNYDQPDVVNLCQSLPKSYQYMPEAQ